MAAELLEEDEEQSAARARQRDVKRRKKEAQKGKLKQEKSEARAESLRLQLLVNAAPHCTGHAEPRRRGYTRASSDSVAVWCAALFSATPGLFWSLR